jgi:hypothetical protein
MKRGRRKFRPGSLWASTVVVALATLALAVFAEGLLGPLPRSGSHTLAIAGWTSGAALLAGFAGAREAAFARRARTRPLPGDSRR